MLVSLCYVCYILFYTCSSCVFFMDVDYLQKEFARWLSVVDGAVDGFSLTVVDGQSFTLQLAQKGSSVEHKVVS